MANREKPHWPGWFYGPDGEAEIFQCRDDVPAGWEDHPSKVNSAVIAPTAELAAEFQPVEIVANKIDAPDSIKGAPIKAKRPYRRKAK